MKIGITRSFGDVLPLFINLAIYLKENGEEVFFIDPEPRVIWLLKKYKLDYLSSRKEIIHNNQITDETNTFLINMKTGLEQLRKGDENNRYTMLKRRYLHKHSLFERTSFDLLIIWNGALSLEKRLAEKLSIDTVYLENGYFPDTLQIGRKGVNSNADFSDMNYDTFLAHTHLPSTSGLKKIITKDVTTHPIQNILNIGLLIYNPFDFLTKVLIYSRKMVAKFKTIFLREKHIVLPEKFIFIPFQVHDDTQTLFNSPIIKKMNDILDFFYPEIKEVLPDHKIIVKEHPVDLGRADYNVLKKKYPDIIWLKKYNFNELLNKCDYVITVNSSSGLQAIEKYKKVLILGSCFYKNNPFTEYISRVPEFRDKLNILKEKSLDKSHIDKYIKHFKKNIFIQGGLKNFRSETLVQIYAFIKS